MFLRRHICFLFLFFLSITSSDLHAYDRKKLRARQSYYKAKVYYEMGQHRKSVKLLKTASRLDPENMWFQNAMNHFAATSGKKSNIRNNNVKKVSQPLQIVLSINNAGIYQSKNKKQGLSRDAFELALKTARQVGLKNDTLLSHLYNNMACGLLMDQAVCQNRNTMEEAHRSIHFNIILKVFNLFHQALLHFPDNPTVIRNLEVIYNSMDSLDQPVLAARGLFPWQGFVKDHTENTLTRPAISKQVSAKTIKTLKSASLISGEFKELVQLAESYDEIVLLIDNSVSMNERIPSIGKCRYEVLKQILTKIMIYLDDSLAVGCLSVSGNHCSAPPLLSISPVKGIRANLLQQIITLETKGKTPLDLRMEQATSLFTDASKKRMILLCSDGLNTCYGFNTCDIAQKIKERGIDIHVLSLLVDKMSNLEEYAVYDCVSESGGGKLWKIDDQGEIEQTAMELPVMLYPVLLPDQISKLKCLGPNYHHTYIIPLSANLSIDEGNGWVIKY